MAEIVGAFGGGGGNRTHSDGLIPEQDQGPASAEAGTGAVPQGCERWTLDDLKRVSAAEQAGTEAVPNRLEALLWHLEHGKHMPRHWKLELLGFVRKMQADLDWLDRRLGVRGEHEYVIAFEAPHDPDEPALPLREAIKVAQDFERLLAEQDRS